MPCDDVRVVFELGDDDLIARPEMLAPPGCRDEVDRFSGATGEHDLLGPGGAEESRNMASSTLVGVCRFLTKGVDATMHVCVRVLVERGQCVNDGTGLLRRRSIIEVDERLAVNLSPQDW